jgi:hypothetical protein
VTPHRDDWDEAERDALEPVGDELAALRERHRHDPPFELLRAARADALPEALQEQASAHLESSAWSRVLVEGADEAEIALDAAAASRLLARVKKGSAAPAARGARWLWAPALALASVAVIVLAVLVSRTERPAPTQTSTTADRAPAATAQPPTARGAQTFRLELKKPDVKLTATALLLRGEGRTDRFVDDVAPGLNAYRNGDYAGAARELEALRPRYPKSVEVAFYLGVSRLLAGDSLGAADALESARAMRDDTFTDDATWYLAVAYERAGAPDRARPLIEALCGGKGAYAARACDAAPSLR